ncbi:MAG: alpha-(1-_3)-arabinofuranosyltransferase family protein [Microthrixaceae bacterium]
MTQVPVGRIQGWIAERRVSAGLILLAVVSYLPLLLTKPGQVGADTKTYLYLNPGRLLSRAPFMWDPNIGLGTVTHQNIGYLWPMGPYYFVMQSLGLPDWVAQRIWLGSIIFMAGLGMRFMLKELRWRSSGVTVASFAYALSPYLINYGARISVILLPFAGLPWLIGLAARSLRRADWRTPALFALVTLTVGGVNATSLLLVMVGPMLWFVYATCIEREVGFVVALKAAGKITLLTIATSVWWVVGLMTQGAHGISILRYTETYETVANAALAPELLRGLGYWFFYGTDGLGAWTQASRAYVESPPLIALSFLLPLLAVLAAILTRFRHRIFFAAIVLIGLVIGVGSHPWDTPSPYGNIFKAFTQGDLGLSFRSTPRSVPLIALGLAVFLGAGVAAISSWRPRWHRFAAGLLLVMICLNQLPLFQGLMVDRNLDRKEKIPEYWLQAAESLDKGDTETRVLEVPGSDFASYRWGNTVDPITPGLTDREYAARELIPYGSPASANFLNDFDLPFQSGRVEPTAIAPLARLLGVGDILLRADLQQERFRTPRPRVTSEQLNAAPGLDLFAEFGPATPNMASNKLPLDDELEFNTPSTTPDPAAVSLFRVQDTRPILRTVQASSPTVLAGNAAGLVNFAATAGMQVDRPIFYSASFVEDQAALKKQINQPFSELIVTDTNRKQARRWGAVRDNDGYTERAGERPLVKDNTDNRLEVFPEQGDAQRTVVEQRGGATVAASTYGNGVTYTAGDRAANALDGDSSTAWRVAAFADPVGEFLEISLDSPRTTNFINLEQVQGGANRYITELQLSFDGGAAIPVTLDQASQQPGGQRIEFPERSFTDLRLTITATDRGDMASYRGVSGVGFAEIAIPGLGLITEVVRPPTDLLMAAGDISIDHQLSYVFTRRASNPSEVIAADEEVTMRRIVSGPIARSFTPFGRVRMTASLPDERIDQIIGLPSAAEGGVDATSSARLPNDPGSRASTAIDGDLTTAYQTPVNAPLQSLEFTYPEAVTIDSLNLAVIADGKHSIPTELSVSADGREAVKVPLAPTPLGTAKPRGSTTALTAALTAASGPITAKSFRISIDAVQEASSTDWFGGGRTVLPVGVAEIGLPVVAAPLLTAKLPSECRSDLATLADQQLLLQVTGTVGSALASASLTVQACSTDTAALELSAGESLLETAPGATTGFDVDMLVLSSAPGGSAGIDTLQVPPDAGPTPPTSTTQRTGKNNYSVTTTAAQQPYWVILGQSFGPGWSAKASDGTNLGPPRLINGYANGWLVDPSKVGQDTTVSISWGPQKLVWAGLGISGFGLLVCVALAIFGGRRRHLGPSGESAAIMAEMTPHYSSPLLADGPVLGATAALVTTFCSGLLAVFVAGPWVGVVVAVLTLSATRLARGQIVLRVVAVSMLALACAFIVLKQTLNGYKLDFDWVKWFETTHSWGLLAILLLAIEVAVDGLRSQQIKQIKQARTEESSGLL